MTLFMQPLVTIPDVEPDLLRTICERTVRLMTIAFTKSTSRSTRSFMFMNWKWREHLPLVLLLATWPWCMSAQVRTEKLRDKEYRIARALSACDSLLYSSPKEALKWAGVARQLVTGTDLPGNWGNVYERLARAHLELWGLDAAMSHADSALIAYRGSGEGNEERAEQLIGEVYLRMGDLVAAVDHLESALDRATQRDDQRAMAAIRMRLAYAHYMGHQPVITYAHLDTCNKIFHGLQDRSGLAASYNRRAIAMAEDNDLDSLPLAKLVADSARYWARLATDSVELARIHINTALMLMNMEDTAGARAHTDTAMYLARALRDSFLLVHAYENMGQIHLRTNEPDRARNECGVMLHYGLRHGILRLQRDAWDCIKNSATMSGDWETAYRAYERYVELNEGMVNTQARERILHRSLMMEAGRREEALREVHEARMTTFWVAALLLLVVLAGGGSFLVMRQKNKVERERAKALRLQIDQHFVGNAMASVGNYVLKEDRDLAYRLLVRYDRFIRSTLDHASAERITLAEEMESLRNFLEIERDLSGARFDHVLECQPDLDPEEILIAPMLIQPWVENAIKHGVKPLDAGGVVMLRFFMVGDLLEVTVQDNGNGSRKMPKDHHRRSWGTHITRTRMDSLSRLWGRVGSYTFVDVPTGTKVVLRLPVMRT